VELEATPWIWRIQPDFTVLTHTGQVAQVRQCLMDEAGRVYLLTDLGFGLVYTQDVALAADAVQAGVWTLTEMAAQHMPERFGYVASPDLLSKR